MNDRLSKLRAYAAANPLLGQPDQPDIGVISIENGKWAVGLSANR